MTKQSKSGVRKPQWWKHLRDWKRVFWKKDRQEGKRETLVTTNYTDPKTGVKYDRVVIEGHTPGMMMEDKHKGDSK